MRLRSTAGHIYIGKVLRSTDPTLIKHPRAYEAYGCSPDGAINRNLPLYWDRDEKVWRKVK